MKLTMSIFTAALFLSAQGALQRHMVDAGAKGSPFPHYWSFGVGAGRVNEGLRAAWHEHLALASEQCGFRYVRMHDTFNDDMFVYFGDGKYNWQYVDEVYDRMLAKGVRPFVELSFFPSQLAKENSRTVMWYRGHVEPDRAKYPAWGRMIEAFARHLVERYGIDEIQKWYFEVWNEPNLYWGFFHGTKSDYFELYRVSANAIKSVHPSLKVGGPATSNFIADSRHDGEIQDNGKSVFFPQETINSQQWKGVWIEDFLAFCDREKLPVDFISCHAYPTDYALDPVSGRGRDAIRYVHSLRDDLTWLKRVVGASRYKNAELHITEWNTSPNSRDNLHDNLPPAAYIAKTMLECAGLADSVMYWTFTDIFEEKGGGRDIFHGGFGLLNFQGIAKPSFHAYRMLNALGDEVLYNTAPVVVTRDSTTGKIAVLAYAYPKEYESHVPAACNTGNYMEASPTEVDLLIGGLKPGSAFTIETLDDTHGNAIMSWRAMGRPQSPTREETAVLKSRAEATRKGCLFADSNGVLHVLQKLQPWSLVLICEK